jgi:hypothetical protein
MGSAAAALGWELWARHRWVLGTVGAYLLGLAGLCRVLPAELLAETAPVTMMMVPLLSMTFVLAAFSYGFDARLESAASCFPARLLTLPVRTAALAGWPMLYGALTLALGWVGFARLVLGPAGMRAPLVWPGLLLTACLCWLQALIWAPFPLAWLRLVAIAAVVSALPAGAANAWLAGTPEWLLASLLAGLSVAAYGLAVVGLTRARHGEGVSWAWPGRLRTWLAGRRRRSERPFSSPEQALLWLEWHRQGKTPQALAGVLAAGLLVLAYTVGRILEQVAGTGAFPGLDAAVRVTGTGWLVLAYLAAIPLLLVGALSVESGKLRTQGRGYALTSFLATRPVTEATLVGVKLRATAQGTLALWALTLGVALLWAGLTGRFGELAERWGSWYGSGLRGVAALLLALSVLVVLTWAQAVRGLWVALGGRIWVAWLSVVACLGFVIAASLLAAWLPRHPQRWATLLDRLPALLGGLVALKLLAAAWLGARVVRRGLLSRRTLLGGLAAWIAVVAGLVAALTWLLPAGLVRPLVLASVVVLVVPLAECLLAPLALAWNRHR